MASLTNNFRLCSPVNCLQLLLTTFRVEAKKAQVIASRIQREKEEREAKRKETLKNQRINNEKASESAAITEITDEEAAKMQQEIDLEK